MNSPLFVPAHFVACSFCTAKKIWAEVNILSRLSASDNVAKLHAVYEDATHVYLVQELCQGGDLEALVSVCDPL